LRPIPRLLVTSRACPKSGPFPPPALPGFRGTTSLSATPRRPGLSLAGVRLRSRCPPPLGFPVLRPLSLCRHAVAITPVGPQVGSSRSPGTCDGGLPHPFAGSAPTLPVSRPTRRSLTLRPAYSRNRLMRSFASKASAVSLPPLPLRLLPAGTTLAGWELHPLKIAALARRTKGSG
jgi:hypothetical protein